MLRLFVWCFSVLLGVAHAQDFTRSHALIMHGEPALAADFAHFDYVNPEAPKQGMVTFDATGTYDTFNPFIVKGNSVAGIGRIYDTLLTSNPDEAFTQYGLLAETIDLAEDYTWVRFNLRPEARFHDGHPLRAEDVVFTFNTLIEEGAPFYRAYYGNVVKVEAESELAVRFTFKDGSNRELPLILGQLPVLPKHYWADKEFNKADLTRPLGSGPYQIDSFDAGRSIRYALVKDYWGKDLAVNVGRNNFAQINYEYYRDSSVALEAFKAGRIDYRLETSAKDWATAYTGPQFDSGEALTVSLENHNPQGMQSFAFNTRRDKFSDIRVRQALGLMFDFEWTNQQLFYGAYSRSESFFAASELAATGLPSEGELALLKPFKAQLPEALFTQPFRLDKTGGDGNLRPQMRQALALLKEAGWSLQQGKLVDDKGEQFKIEFLLFQKNFERIVLPYTRNLQRIGIASEVRLVDVSQYINRVQSFDFDMMVASFPQSSSPGNEQREFWGSKAADQVGSRNVIGIKSEVIDSLVETLIHAPDRQALIDASRALDRVLLWSYYVVPQWHLSAWRVAHWNKLQRPERNPQYDIGLDSWWVE
ncbi:extracellular solute-binding protein [Aliagarivorans marinus]|uniref:extracellular solute-binding protein n=1 Tax=Aliagarivorans marinus TaxID=561965 RepID=UPI0003FE1946|nr:extracellular solute-binding protein [Aliagarivorans marinus]